MLIKVKKFYIVWIDWIAFCIQSLYLETESLDLKANKNKI